MTLQQKIVNNKWYRVIMPIVLTIAVLVVFVFSPFGQARALTGVEEAVVVVLIAGLAAVGITFASTGGFDTLTEYVGELMEEYALDNNTTVFGITNGLNSSANAAGKVLLNNRFVLFIDVFARWLKNKFSLANNTTINVVTPGTTIGGLVSYSLPLRIYSNSSSVQDREWVEVTASAPMYAVLATSSDTLTINVWSEEPGQYQIVKYRHNGSSQQGVLGPYNLSLTASGVYKANYNGLDPDYFPTSGYTTYTSTVVNGVFNDPNTTVQDTSAGIDIQVGSMNLPTDDPNYTTDDGAILDVGATWGVPYTNVVYGEIPTTWPDVVDGTINPTIEYHTEAAIEDQLPEAAEIENLPGGMTIFDPDHPDGDIGNIFDLRLSTIWHYVQQWIADFSVAGGLLWNAATSLPNPAVNMVYAMIVIALVFGLIKIFRG